MDERFQQRTASREQTRQAQRSLLMWLPLELVRMIVMLAAQDDIAIAPKWVAQSLAIVCRAFCNAVEPVLVETVRITAYNYCQWVIFAQKHRFARTKHLICNGSIVPLSGLEPFPFTSLLSFSGNAQTVQYFANYAAFRPRAVSIGRVYERSLPALRDSLGTVVRLHIRQYWSHIDISILLLPSNTHLILDPMDTGFVAYDVWQNVSSIRELLRSNRQLERLLVRSTQLEQGKSALSLVEELDRVAGDERDPRLWLDDSIAYQSNVTRVLELQPIEETSALDAKWFSSRQLYTDSEPPLTTAKGIDGLTRRRSGPAGRSTGSEESPLDAAS